jgi:hypothetical protein
LNCQSDFFDDKTMDKSRSQLYEDLASRSFPSDGERKAALLAFLGLKGEGNSGSKATQLVKWAVKYHRLARSVHVTPTVFLNGLEAGDVGSGWTVEQWTEKLDNL